MGTVNDSFIITGLSQASLKWVEMKRGSVTVTIHSHYSP